MIGLERSTFVVANSVSPDEKVTDVQLQDEPSGTSGVHESRWADNVLNTSIIDSSEAAVVPGSPIFTRIEEADLATSSTSRTTKMCGGCFDDMGTISGDANALHNQRDTGALSRLWYIMSIGESWSILYLCITRYNLSGRTSGRATVRCCGSTKCASCSGTLRTRIGRSSR